MRAIKSGEPIFASSKWGPFERLANFDPGIIVDAGAAAGHMTNLALKYAKPGSRAISFEPFPGNWPIVEKTLADRQATLVKAALGDKEGTVDFFVSGTAKADGKWAGFEGYSSVGHIVNAPSAKTNGRTIRVPVTTVDAHVDERVVFMKIDVQGGELEVLNGSKRTFERGIDSLYIEFGGELDILDFLFDRDYVVYDHRYLVIPTRAKPDPKVWRIEGEQTLSTGQLAYHAWPVVTPGDPDAYCEMLTRETKRIGAVFTDIVAVRKDLNAQFSEA
jgi:FkbM family methyltransferase